jgi:hypothetical protein
MQIKNGARPALMLALVASLWGCAHTTKPGLYAEERARISRMDDFDMLLMKAGVDVEEFPTGEALTAQQANDLLGWLRLKISDGNMAAYGPRIMASFLLEEALKTGKSIPRRSLTAGLRLHTQLVVLTPEGHLVRAYSGALLQCAGPLQIQGGVPRAGGFQVDAFYVQDGDSFREDPQLVAPAIFLRPEPQRPSERVAGNEAH